MDALAAAAARQKPVNPATATTTTTTTASSSASSSPSTPQPTSPSTPASRPSALSINFLVESSSSPYFVEEEDASGDATNKPSEHVVVDEQLRAHTPNRISRHHLDEVDGDDGQGEGSASPTTTAHRASPFDHLLRYTHPSSTLSSVTSAPMPSSTSSTPSTSRNNSPTPPPGPCVVLPRPVRPITLPSPALPAYPPLHATTTAATYPYPAYYPLTSFASSSLANNPSPRSEATTSSTSSNTPTPPVPMLTTPGAGPVIDLQFLSQLYLQASPYLLAGHFPTAAATATTSSSSSSTTMSGGHHQAAVFAQSAGQQAPGYPGIHLQQQVFHQAMALAQLHPLQQQQHPQQQHHIQLPSVHRESSTALAPITPARSIDRQVPNHHQQQHYNQRHQSAGLGAGGDRMSVLESILARAERHAQEENARNLARGIKREKSEPRNGEDGRDDYATPSRSDRIKRRRTDSNSSDSDYSPSGRGGQRRTQSDDDEHHRRPAFISSSSGSSDDEDDENCGGTRRAAVKHQGVVGTGMKEMLYKRRQASPKQVVLLEQVFAVEPIPTSATKLRLSEVLNMSPKRVTVWFKNKRARQKKKGIPLPNSTITTTTASTSAASSPGGPTTPTSVRTSPIDRKFATSSVLSSSSSTTAAYSSPPPARKRGDQHLTFHYFDDRDGDDSAAAP